MNKDKMLEPQEERRIVLCVDDDKRVLETIENQLKLNFGDNCILEFAQSGEEGLWVIESCIEEYGETPHIVVSDFLMPEMNGDEFLERVHSKYPQIIKILLTGETEKNNIIDVINKASLYRFIEKPWDNNDFNLTISHGLDLYHKNQTLEKQRLELLAHNRDLEIVVSQRTKELRVKNELIESSFRYAKLIQNSLLPDASTVSNYFKDSFVFDRPVQTVSGDCYLFAQEADKLIVAAIDCTGHGMPGALLSMIVISELKRIVADEHILCPSKILEKLHERVIQVLNQKTSKVEDGMDVSILVYDTKENYVEFAGARRPMIWVSDGKLLYQRGSALPIGGFVNYERTYEKTKVVIDTKTNFYLFTDGYVDQFGGKEDKKFMISRFRNMLLNQFGESMRNQYFNIRQELESWQGDSPQIDDILVIGLSIGE